MGREAEATNDNETCPSFLISSLSSLLCPVPHKHPSIPGRFSFFYTNICIFIHHHLFPRQSHHPAMTTSSSSSLSLLISLLNHFYPFTTLSAPPPSATSPSKPTPPLPGSILANFLLLLNWDEGRMERKKEKGMGR